jgi:hypothetical protein
MMNGKGFERKRLWPNRGNIPELWREPSVTIACVRVEVRCDSLPNTSTERYRHVNPLRLKHLYLSTKLHDVTSNRTVITARTPNLVYCFNCQTDWVLVLASLLSADAMAGVWLNFVVTWGISAHLLYQRLRRRLFALWRPYEYYVSSGGGCFPARTVV